MESAGARVVGHRARVHGNVGGSFVLCDCGFQSRVIASVDSSCLALVDHLQSVVRLGAEVTSGEDGGEAGVREPRRPLYPLGSASAAVECDNVTRSA